MFIFPKHVPLSLAGAKRSSFSPFLREFDHKFLTPLLMDLIWGSNFSFLPWNLVQPLSLKMLSFLSLWVWHCLYFLGCKWRGEGEFRGEWLTFSRTLFLWESNTLMETPPNSISPSFIFFSLFFSCYFSY